MRAQAAQGKAPCPTQHNSGPCSAANSTKVSDDVIKYPSSLCCRLEEWWGDVQCLRRLHRLLAGPPCTPLPKQRYITKLLLSAKEGAGESFPALDPGVCRALLPSVCDLLVQGVYVGRNCLGRPYAVTDMHVHMYACMRVLAVSARLSHQPPGVPGAHWWCVWHVGQGPVSLPVCPHRRQPLPPRGVQPCAPSSRK
jgi:hypothetical protein